MKVPPRVVSIQSHPLRKHLPGLAFAIALSLGLAACGGSSEGSKELPEGTGGNPTSSGGAASGGLGPSGGAFSTGGVSGSSGGATANSGGTVGVESRPPETNGNGFFVKNGKLYDPKGSEFRIRGINKLHFDAPSPGIAKTHANTIRWVLPFGGEWGSSAAGNLALMENSIAEGMVPMPGNWDGTCKEDPALLTGIVDKWIEQFDTWHKLDDTMLLNIANEWGPSNSTVWRDSYVTAVQRLRDAGYTSTLVVDAGGCGQDNDDLAKYAQAVFEADPQHNVIFDQHIYGNWASDAAEGWQTKLSDGLDALKNTGLAVFVGEFGPGNNIGPSPTSITPQELITACEARELGWMAWAWDDPAYNPDSGWFAMSMGAQSPFNGDYLSSADLTPFGKIVVEDPTVGLLALARPATHF